MSREQSLRNGAGLMVLGALIQPLNIVAASKARAFLCEADILVTDVRALFLNRDDFATAARLKDIQDRLADEIQVLERLIAAQ